MKPLHFIVSLLFIFLLSCTPTATRQSMIPDEDHISERPEPDYPALPEDITLGGYVVEDPMQVIVIADTVASNAEIFALNADFPQAHTMFGISLELINALHQGNELDSVADTELLFTRIAEFYVDLLPPAYLDSVPEEISSFVSKYQLNDMLNGMGSGDVDSSVLANFECGESSTYNIPITYNERVQQALTALLRTGRRNWIETLLKRAHYYRPVMNERFDAAGLPTDLTFLPILESAFNPKAYSPAHASGLWQFIPSTGRMYNLRANYWVDERRDPMKSTNAAIGYFTRLNGMFDDWYLSLASYNCGEGRVGRTLARTEDAEEFWDIELPRETMNYVPLFIAYQIIAKNPHCFGFDVDTTAPTYDLEVVQVSDCIDLHKIADGIGISFDSLKSMNPHIVQWCTPPNMEGINLYIPSGTSEQYNNFYAALSERDKVDWYRYQIQSGDVLGQIADKFDVSLSALKQINNMSSNRIIAGRYIFVPIPANSSVSEITSRTGSSSNSNMEQKNHTVRRGETLSTIAPQYDVTVAQICSWNGITNAAVISVGQQLKVFVPVAPVVRTVPTPTGDKQLYTVQAGESLYTISLKLGVTVNELAAWNNKDISHPIIHPGEQLAFYGTPSQNRQDQVESAEATAAQADGNSSTYTVQSGESLYTISLKLGVTVNELAIWNEKDVANPLIHPGETLKYYTSSGDTETAATATSTSVATEPSSQPRGERQSYRVQAGESLFSISQKLDVTVADMIEWNGKDSDNPVIYPNELLIYFGAAVEETQSSTATESSSSTSSMLTYRVNSGDSMYGIAQNFGITVNEILAANGGNSNIHPGDHIRIPVTATTQGSSSSSETIAYRVVSGDNLWSIASNFNVSVHEICTASDITRSTQLHPGDILRIPVKE